MKRTLGTDDWAQWMSPSHPETARRARVRHVDHRWLQHREGRRPHARTTATSGRCVRTSARSQAIDEGRLEEEIVPIEVKLRDGTTKIFDTDEHPRRDSTMEKMASLKPLHPEIEDFPITAGNSSGLNDARRGDDDRQQRLRAGATA